MPARILAGASHVPVRHKRSMFKEMNYSFSRFLMMIHGKPLAD